jgi:hypothetical protein
MVRIAFHDPDMDRELDPPIHKAGQRDSRPPMEVGVVVLASLGFSLRNKIKTRLRITMPGDV